MQGTLAALWGAVRGPRVKGLTLLTPGDTVYVFILVFLLHLSPFLSKSS